MPTYYPPLTPPFSVEDAQDAVGAMVDATLVYNDATPSLGRAAITGDVTIAAGSNAAVLQPHASRHEDGGSDEIDVTGLSGLLDDPQTPLAHKTSHQSGGSDAIKLDDLATPDDNTDLDATTTEHGLLPKLSGSTTDYLRGDGVFAPVNASPVHSLARYVHGFEWYSGNINGVVASGMPAITGSGTSSDGDDSDGNALIVTHTAATIGQTCSRRTSLNYYIANADTISYTRIKTGADITSVNYLIGLGSANVSGNTSGDPGGHAAMFRYNTTADGTAFWRTVTRDGSTVEVQTTSVAIAASTLYELVIETTPTAVRFYINGVLVSTHVTNIPAATVPMIAGWFLVALANATRALRAYHFAVSHKS